MKRRFPWIVAAASVLLWCFAHVLMHQRRGWPSMNVWGEWDFLLTAQAIAAGHAPDAVLGSMHGNELGSYLVAALVAVPVSLGVDAVVAAKGVAMGFGMVFVGAAGWLAGWMANEAGAEGGPTRTAASLSAVVLAFAWPGLHFELAGLSGRTPEAAAFQLLAIAAVLTASERHVVGRGLFVGAALGVGWLLSPVTLWTAAACAVVGLLVLPTGPSRVRASAAAGAGFVLPLVLFALLVPGGAEGLSLFRVEQMGGAGVGDAVGGKRLGFDVIAQVHLALEGGAHNPALSARPVFLGALGWALMVSLVAFVVQGVRARDWRSPRFLAALLALSWLVPIVLLPVERWFYPLAFRYWMVLLALGIALGPLALLRMPPKSAVGAFSLLAALVVVMSNMAPIQIVAPAPSRSEALVSAAAHSMGPRPGRDRHATFWALVPHAPAEDQVALSEGYGMMLGADLAVDLADGRDVVFPWASVAPMLPEPARTRFLVGVGCGVTASKELPPAVTAAFLIAPPEVRQALVWGLGRCAEAEVPLAAVRASAAYQGGRERRPVRGIESTVADPKPLMPPRW